MAVLSCGPRAIAVSCAVIAIAVPSALLIIRAKRRSKEYVGPHYTAAPVVQWNVHQVAQWLQSLSVSQGALVLFLKNDVDGSMLLLLDDKHLALLAPKLRDLVFIKEGLKKLHAQKADVVPPQERLLVTEAYAPKDDERQVAEFLQGVNVIHNVLSSREFERAALEGQITMRQQCAQKFHDLVDKLQGISPELQAKLLPLMGKLESLVFLPHKDRAAVPSAAAAASVAATATSSGATPSVSNELAEQVKTLHDMMDNILRVLDSAGAALMLDPQAAPLRNEIGLQLIHVTEVINRLPPQYGESLRRKCDLVLQKIRQNTASGAIASELEPDPGAEAATVTAQAHQHPQSQTMLDEPVMKRLSDIFATLRSSDILKMQPSVRLGRISRMLNEIKLIKEEVERWNDSRAVDVVRRITGDIIPVLQQMKSITLEEMGSAVDNTEEGECNEGQRDEVNPGRIIASLKAIIQALHSSELANAPQEAKVRMLSRMNQVLLSLRQQIDRLPRDRNSATLIGMIEQNQQLVQSLLEGSPAGVGRGTGQEEKDQGEEYEEMPSNTFTSDVGDLERQEGILDKSVADLEKMFDYINSEEFERLPLQERGRMSQGQLALLAEIEKNCANCGEESCHLRDLIDSMKAILQLEVGGIPAATGPTPLFLNIMSQLTQVSKLLNSDDFKKASLENKKLSVRCLIPRLQELMSSQRQLPSHERAEVDKVILPINRILKCVAEENRHSTAAPVVVDPRQVISQVEGLLSILQSEEFLQAPAERRQSIAVVLLKRLEGLEEDCSRIGGPAAQLLPIVKLMGAQLRPLAQATHEIPEEANLSVEAEPTATLLGNESAGNNVSAFAEGRETNDVATQDQQETAGEVTEINEEAYNGMGGRVRGPAREKHSPHELLQMMDSAGVGTGRSRKELGNLDAQMRRALGETVPASNAFSPDVHNFVHTFEMLKKRLSSLNPSSLIELFPIMRVVDEELKKAAHKVPWRECPEALKLVDEVLSRIQELQSRLTTRQPSDGENNSNAGQRELDESLPQKKEGLQPQPRMPLQDGEEMGSLAAAAPLQATEVAPKRVKDMVEPTPNTKEQAHQNRSEEVRNENTGGDDDDTKNETDRISGVLIDMSNRLRDSPVPNEVLDEYGELLDHMQSLRPDPSLSDAIESVQEQIRLRRILNNEDSEDGEVTGDTLVADGSSAILGEEEKLYNPHKVEPVEDNAVSEISLDGLPENGIPGAEINELVLLPRIEKRLECAEQHFIENTTLFDIQNISKVILHLEQNDTVKASVELSGRVKSVKKTFAHLLEAFRGSDQQSAAVHSALRLRCRDTVVGGESVRELVICTDVEATSVVETCSNRDLLKCLTEGKATKTTVPAHVVKSWMGKSTAVLFCEMDEKEGTVLSELALLHEVLMKRYGFDVVTVTSASATQLCGLLRKIAKSGAKRLFLFYLTGACASSSPYAAPFRDGSTLNHRVALQQAFAVDRVVVAHCQPLKLTVVSALAGRGGQFFSVELTEAASAEVRAARCWLYDGLFTPALTELLCLDEGHMLCPEDLVTYAVTSMSSLCVDFGSFTDGKSSSMGFFVPVDASE